MDPSAFGKKDLISPLGVVVDEKTRCHRAEDARVGPWPRTRRQTLGPLRLKTFFWACLYRGDRCYMTAEKKLRCSPQGGEGLLSCYFFLCRVTQVMVDFFYSTHMTPTERNSTLHSVGAAFFMCPVFYVVHESFSPKLTSFLFVCILSLPCC